MTARAGCCCSAAVALHRRLGVRRRAALSRSRSACRSPSVAGCGPRSPRRPMRLHRRPVTSDHVEGEDVLVELELASEGALAPASVCSSRRSGGSASERRSKRRGHRLRGALRRSNSASRPLRVRDVRRRARRPVRPRASSSPRRARARCSSTRGSSTSTASSPTPSRRTGPAAAAPAPGGLRPAQRPRVPAGRVAAKVHWPPTARRGELMVKDFDDARA